MKQQTTTKSAPTAAQSAILHVAQSAGLSALVTLLIGITQYLSSGNINLPTLYSVLGGGFLTALTMLYKSVSSNPQLAQAALDTANEAIQRIEQLSPSWLTKDIAQVQKSVPKPINFPSQGGAAQQSGGGGLPPDYYSRYRQSLPDMATQGYVPAVQGNQSMLYNLANPQQNFPPPALPQSQQGG